MTTPVVPYVRSQQSSPPCPRQSSSPPHAHLSAGPSIAHLDPPRRPHRAAGIRGPGQGPAAQPTTSRTSCSAAACPAASRASTWRAWSPASGYDNLPGTTVTRYCSSSLEPPGWPTTPHGRRGRRVHLGRRGIVTRFATGSSDSRPTRTTLSSRTRRPVPGRSGRAASRSGTTPGRTPRSRTSTSRWARRRRTSPRCAGFRGRPGRVRRPVAEPGREGARQRVLAAGHHPGHPPGRDRGERGRRPAARTTLEKVATLKPVFRPDGPSPPGTAARSTTARPRSW